MEWTELEKYLVFLFLLLAALFSGSLLYYALRRLMDSKISERNSKFISRMAQYLVVLAGIYWGIYYILHLNFRALAASLGILSVAIAFSSQQLVQNIIAGIIISAKRSVWYEDWVEIAGTGLCRVKDIALTQTVLKAVDGRILYLPNALLLSSVISNYSRSGPLEASVQISVPGQSGLGIVRRVILAAAERSISGTGSGGPERKAGPKHILESAAFGRKSINPARQALPAARILIGSISEEKVTLTIAFWIREVQRKPEIISDFLAAIHEDLRNAGIPAK